MKADSLKIKLKMLLKRNLPVRTYNYIISTYMVIGKTKYICKNFLLRHRMFLFNRYPAFLYPEDLFIFLTTRCNLRCFICRRENFKANDLDFDNIYKLEKAIKNASIIDLTGWGEPFLYPRFKDVVNYILYTNSKGRILQITSNGTLLSRELGEFLKSKIHFFNISLNAATKETYNRDMVYGDFDKTIVAIKDFVGALAADDINRLSLHFVAHANNFSEIPQFIRLAKELGINRVNVGQYMAGCTSHDGYTLLNVKEEYNEVIVKAELMASEYGIVFDAPKFFDVRPVLSSDCLDPLRMCIVGVDGQVSPCCFAGSYSLGNAYELGFEAVWFGDEYQRLRNKRYLKACQQCTPYVPLDNPAAHYDPHYKATLDK